LKVFYLADSIHGHAVFVLGLYFHLLDCNFLAWLGLFVADVNGRICTTSDFFI
jgi:hypothetical protein